MSQSENNQEYDLLPPENQSKRYDSLFYEIDAGNIKLPMFQREFVWGKEKTAQLIDSILKSFPIGTFIFWKTKEELGSYKDIGNHTLPKTPKGDYVYYILDGQQRITSLYAVRKGIRITKDKKEIDYKDIFIDLDFNSQKDEKICVVDKVHNKRYISVYELLNSQMSILRRKFDNNDTVIEDKLEKYKAKLTSYDFSTITIKDYPIHIACDIFSRINTGGKPLTIFEIMVAKTYDENYDFNLAKKYDVLCNNVDEQDKSLRRANFETVSETIIMQCNAVITLKSVKSRDILEMSRQDFIDNWQRMKESLFTAIDFIRTQLYIPISQILPYASILVAYTYFFSRIKNPNNTQIKLLEQFFYWVGITERYSSGTESKLAEDFQKMDCIISNKSPVYNNLELNIDPQAIAIKKFSAGNSYCKTIICLLASQGQKSFDKNGIVILDNSNLKNASNKNYHHFFPKEYINQNHKSDEANLMANITLIDAASNIRIGKKPPSDYLNQFKDSNPDIEITLKKHLIMDIQEYGLNDNNYKLFIQKRAQEIADQLNKKLRVLPNLY